MLNAIAIIEKKLDGILPVNLEKLLLELDKQIAAARKVAEKTEDFSEVQAMNTVRTAVINKLDEHDPAIFDNYCAAKAVA